jgi:hypothetical protein
MPRSADQSYKARLGEVLRRRDPAALHLFLRQSAAGYGDERQVSEVEERSHREMEELMHRMILARPDLSELHAESQAWLAARNPGERLPTASRTRRPSGPPNRIRGRRDERPARRAGGG